MPRSATPVKFETHIQQVNRRLKLAQMGLQVELRGKTLALRGTLPPKPNSSRKNPYQQRISLKLPPTLSGLKQAEREAKVVAAQLITETFNWEKYAIWKGREHLDADVLSGHIWQFEKHFLQDPARNSSSAQSTWDGTYAPYLKKLEQIAQASRKLSLIEAICLTVESFPIQSRSRQICCTALAAFAAFLEVELPENFKQLGGSYSPSKVKRRDLPTDEEILLAYDCIPNPKWRFVYGMMATYGLRNHEVFFCDYSQLKLQSASCDQSNTVEVLETTKTGEHEVWPFYPEWIDRFELRNVQLPQVSTDLNRTTLQKVGQRVTRQFQRYKIPFSPYDLRHAWAVRTIHFGIPDTVAAKMMGHSVGIHQRTYHKWITRRDQASAVEVAMERWRHGSDRSTKSSSPQA